MERFKIYVNTTYRYFTTEKEAIEFLKKLLALNMGAELSKEEIPKD